MLIPTYRNRINPQISLRNICILKKTNLISPTSFRRGTKRRIKTCLDGYNFIFNLACPSACYLRVIHFICVCLEVSILQLLH